MSNSIVTNHKLETTLSKDGNVVIVDEWQSKQQRVNIKVGWFRMYKDVFEAFRVCNSNLEVNLLIHILENTKKNLTINFKVNGLAEEFKVSRIKISTFIKKLKDVDFIKGSRGLFMVNPKMFVPTNANNEIIKELQDDWDKIKL